MKTIVFDTETLSFPIDNLGKDILVQLCYAVLEDNVSYTTNSLI